jgi:hypothetical protein
VTADMILARVMEQVTAPVEPLHEYAKLNADA